MLVSKRSTNEKDKSFYSAFISAFAACFCFNSH